MAVDALGNPVRLLITPGQQADIKQADALIAGFSADYVIADKGYDADTFIEAIEATKAIAVIPPRCNRTVARDYDEHLYGERNLVERCFQKLKNYRRTCLQQAGLNPKTVAKWKRRDFVHDAKTCLLQAGGPETAALYELIAGRGGYGCGLP